MTFKETFQTCGKGLKEKKEKKKINYLIAYLSSFDGCGKKFKPILKTRMWIMSK